MFLQCTLNYKHTFLTCCVHWMIRLCLRKTALNVSIIVNRKYKIIANNIFVCVNGFWDCAANESSSHLGPPHSVQLRFATRISLQLRRRVWWFCHVHCNREPRTRVDRKQTDLKSVSNWSRSCFSCKVA